MVDDPLLVNVGIGHPMFRIRIPPVLAKGKLKISALKVLDVYNYSRYPADPEGMLSKEVECFRSIKFRIRNVVNLFCRFEILGQVANDGPDSLFVRLVPGELRAGLQRYPRQIV